MRISDWSSDVCSSDLPRRGRGGGGAGGHVVADRNLPEGAAHDRDFGHARRQCGRAVGRARARGLAVAMVWLARRVPDRRPAENRDRAACLSAGGRTAPPRRSGPRAAAAVEPRRGTAHDGVESVAALGRAVALHGAGDWLPSRSEEHTSELQSLMRISYAVFCLKKKKNLTKTSEYTMYQNNR